MATSPFGVGSGWGVNVYAAFSLCDAQLVRGNHVRWAPPRSSTAFIVAG